MLAGNFGVAIPPGNAHVAAPGGNYDWGLTGNGNVHIGCDLVVARALRIRIQNQNTPARRNLRLRSRIPFVCVALVMRADSLTHDDMDLILVGGGYSDRAAITHHAQAAARWEVLLNLIVVAITMAEPCRPTPTIVLVHINFIAQLAQI